MRSCISTHCEFRGPILRSLSCRGGAAIRRARAYIFARCYFRAPCAAAPALPFSARVRRSALRFAAGRAVAGRGAVRGQVPRLRAAGRLRCMAVSPFFENAIQNKFCGTRNMRRNQRTVLGPCSRCAGYMRERKKKKNGAQRPRR